MSSNTAKCAALIDVSPNGAQVAKGDTQIVPVQFNYSRAAGCESPVQYFNATVSINNGVTVVNLVHERTSGQTEGVRDTITGNSASRDITGSHRGGTNAPTCQFKYTLVSGNCFLSDLPADNPNKPDAGAASISAGNAAVALGVMALTALSTLL